VRDFEKDPDSEPRRRQQFADDYAFRFRSGMHRGGKPIAISEWRVTTGDRDVAETVAHLYGGKVEYWETSKEDYLEVLTSASKIQIVIDGPQAILERNILWGRNGPLHECDGQYLLNPEKDAGKECGCPYQIAERKALARSQRGPSPHTSVTFRLAADYNLGLGTFASTSWHLLEELHDLRKDIERAGGKVLCEMSLESVMFTPKAGPWAGRDVEYHKPVIKVLRGSSLPSGTPCGLPSTT
jgi:hypothetical protein